MRKEIVDAPGLAVLPGQAGHLLAGIARQPLDIAQDQAAAFPTQPHVAKSYQRVLYPPVSVVLAAPEPEGRLGPASQKLPDFSSGSDPGRAPLN